MGARRANILNVVHDRTAGDVPIGKAKVVFTVEVRGKDHLDEIVAALREQGFAVLGTEPAG